MKVFDESMIDKLLDGCKTQQDIFGPGGPVKNFIKAIVERAMQAELTHHLGYEKHDPQGNNSGNSRNGSTPKTLKGDCGELQIDIPRDRTGQFSPGLISKHQTRLDGLDEKIISLYARGMTTRDIQDQLQDLYGIEISPTLISQVTDAVSDEVKTWQSRPLDAIYPIVYLDAIVVKIKQGNQVINKAIHLALGINIEGQKELLGMWVTQNEGAKFWLSVLTDMKNRGIQEIYFTCVDGLTGFPEAIEVVFPQAKIQLCLVHMVRQSLKYVSYKDRKLVVEDLKCIYQATTVEAAELALEAFSEKWDAQYPMISRTWLDKWEHLIPFFNYPADIRKVLYTTNAIESLNMSLRKVLKNKRFFPTDEAATKQLYLAMRNISKKWTMPIRAWQAALNRFSIEFAKPSLE